VVFVIVMATTRPTVFVSHSTADDGFVRELGRALGNLQQPVWIDSREVRGGDLLWPKVQAAIREAGALAVVISPAALQSRWVADELRYAIKLQKKRRKAGQDFPVIPLSLDGTRLGFAEGLFDAEPAYIAVSTKPGGLDEALRKILEALGLQLPAELPPTDQPSAQPVEELVLELSQLGFAEHDGIRCASARARLRYEPATPGKLEVQSTASWTFTAPLGPIEAEELRWYLEEYAIWPSGVFHDRAEKVKQALATWGQLLHQAALPAGPTGNVLQAWATIAADAQRRFSVYLEEGLDQNASEDERKVAREAATALLSLPWELMHDGSQFLFQGAKPVRVRRRLPNTRILDVAVVAPPIRILLVTARPEDDACLYRQAVDKHVQIEDTAGEGLVRSNLADALRQLGRYGEARQEIRRAIACGEAFGHAVESWKTWAILADIELAEGQQAAAAAARQKAIELFLVYRRDGGENHELGGRLCAAFTEAMLAGNFQEAAGMLAEWRSRPNLPADLPLLLDALEAILGGRRDPSLAQHPDLYYDDAAEILLLLEALAGR
jgi:tetratricopeptide (TPR) repeat protein